MLNKVFGHKNGELKDMTIYWHDDVTANDLVDDLQRIGAYMMRSSAQKNGCMIVTVRNWFVNDALYKTAELLVDETTEEFIREDICNGRFKAAIGSKTYVA